MQISRAWKRRLLIIDGVIFIILGAFFFLALAGEYVFASMDSMWDMAVTTITTILFTLLIIFTGISLVRRNRHGGMIAAALLVLGIGATLTSYLLTQDMKVLSAFFFYAVLAALLGLGWKELK